MGQASIVVRCIFEGIILLLARAIVAPSWFFAACIALSFASLVPRYRIRLNSLYSRWVCRPFLRLIGVRVEIRSGDRLLSSRPCVFIVNHQSLLDGIIAGTLLDPGLVVIGKHGLRRIPFFGWIFGAAGHLFIDRGNSDKARATIREAERRIVERGLSVLMAPEGTRSRGRGMLPFKKGAFHLAINTGLPLQPMAISPLSRLRFNRWRAGTVVLEFLEPIEVQGMTTDDVDTLLAAAHAEIGKAVERL